MRVSEISGLATDRKIVAFPSPIPELLGVAGIRGALVPVYSLAMLLGYNAETERTRWLALCGTEDSVDLVLSDFDGYIRILLTKPSAAAPTLYAHPPATHVPPHHNISPPLATL